MKEFNKGLLDDYYTSTPEFYFIKMMELVSINNLCRSIDSSDDLPEVFEIEGDCYSRPKHIETLISHMSNCRLIVRKAEVKRSTDKKVTFVFHLQLQTKSI